MDLTRQALQRIDRIYKGRQHVELSIGILKDGETETLHWGPGREDKSDETPVYPVGSICKPFTASLLAKYVSEGILDLNAPLSDYIDALHPQYYPSLLKLATHSSGYGTKPTPVMTALRLLIRMNKPDGILRVNPYRGLDEAQMRRALESIHLKDRTYPFSYSNFGMSVLGYIVGAVNGKGFWDSMDDYIREEFGLMNTSLGCCNMVGYDRKDQPCNCWPWEKTDIIAPAGALLSTVDDLLSFARQQMDGSKPYLALCHQKHAAGGAGFESGLAWRLKKGTDISYHGGNGGAYSAALALDRGKRTAAAVAVNYGLLNLEPLSFELLESL